MSPLLALLLTQAVPPSGAYVELRNQGASKGYVRVINCSGAGVSCAADGGLGTFTVAGSDGGGIVYAPLDAGFWLAHAVASLPNAKDLGALSTGLVINTAGTPSAYAGSSCAASNYVNAVGASGAVTCDVPPGTCSGGISPDVQYNNSGSCGGASLVEVQGNRLALVPENPHPSAITDKALITAFVIDGGWPIVPFIEDPTAGSLTIGWAAGGTVIPAQGTQDVWLADCHFPDGWNAGTTNWIQPAATTTGYTCTQSGGSTAGMVLDAGTWWGTQRWVGTGPLGSTSNNYVACRFGGNRVLRGLTSGTGGFLFWQRVTFGIAPTIQRFLSGVTNNNSTWLSGGASEPSNWTHTVYFGQELQQANIHICSNDTGSASCSDLGNSYPVASGSVYDFWLWAPPAGSYVDWYVLRLPDVDGTARGAMAAGRITTPLPAANVALTTYTGVNSADGGGGNRFGVGPGCLWSHW